MNIDFRLIQKGDVIRIQDHMLGTQDREVLDVRQKGGFTQFCLTDQGFMSTTGYSGKPIQLVSRRTEKNN